MSSYLCVKTNNNSVKSYAIKSSANQPYMRVGTGYLPLTSETTTAEGLRVKQGGHNYRIVETYTTTASTQTSSTNTYTYETSRSSQYDTSSTNTYTYNTSRSSQYDTSRSSQYDTSSTNTYTYETTASGFSNSSSSTYNRGGFKAVFKLTTSTRGNYQTVSELMTIDNNVSTSVATIDDLGQSMSLSLVAGGRNYINTIYTTNSNYTRITYSKSAYTMYNVKSVSLTMAASVHINAHSQINTDYFPSERVNETLITRLVRFITVSQGEYNGIFRASKSTSASIWWDLIGFNVGSQGVLYHIITTNSYTSNIYTKNDKTSTSNYTSSRSSGYTSSRQSDYTTNDKTSTSNYTSSRQSSYTTNDRTSTSNYTTEITVTSG